MQPKKVHIVDAEWLSKIRHQLNEYNNVDEVKIILIDDVQKQFPVVEVPSDEDIEAHRATIPYYEAGYARGVKWLRGKLFNTK